MELVDILDKIKVYFRQILRRWWLVLLTTLAMTTLMIVWALKKEVTYTAVTVFHPQKSSDNATDPFALMFGNANGSGSGNQEMQAILESKYMSEIVAADTVLWRGKPITVAKLFKQLAPPPSFSIDKWLNKTINLFMDKDLAKASPTFKDSVIQVSTSLENMVVLEENERGMVQMSISFNNPPFLKLLSYKYIQKLTDYYKLNRTQKSQDNYRFLVKRTDSVKRELMGALNRGAQMADKNHFSLLAEQQVPVKKTEGEVQILQAMYGQLVTMREAALSQLLQDTPVLQVLDYPNPPYTNNKAKLIIFFAIGLFLGFVLGAILAVLGMLKRDIGDYIKENLLQKKEEATEN